MSEGFNANPPDDPHAPPQWASMYGLDHRHEFSNGGVRPGRIVLLLLLLLVLWLAPGFVEQIQFAVTRGKQRAEAEVARQLLDEGRGPTIGQYRTVVKAVQSSVVGVKASRRLEADDGDELSFFGLGRGLREQDQGSGVIVDTGGYIVTNHHVVARASDVTVELNDGSKRKAQVVGSDPASDLAILKIDAANLTAAPWGKSSDLEVGDPVLAIGSPFGLAHTVTAGILSGTGRHAVVERISYQDFLQTDAAVNPGNSGGPLVNMQGQVVGINTAIVGPTYQGISFAIPSDMAHQVYDQLLKSGKVARGWLGVSMQELAPEEGEKLGVGGAKVSGVVRGSPASVAGIKPRDIITKWNGKPVGSPAELGLEVAWTKAGEKAAVTVDRDGHTMEFTVTVGQRPESLERMP